LSDRNADFADAQILHRVNSENKYSVDPKMGYERTSMELIARYAFIAFVVIAIIAGLVVGYAAWTKDSTYPYGLYDSSIQKDSGYITLVMLVLGIIVGLVTITSKEVQPFLIAAIALMVARIGVGTTADVWQPLSSIHNLLPYWATEILNFIVAFVAPAAVIIAIRAVFAMERKTPPAQ